MSDLPNAHDRPWKAALSEPERARVASAFAADAELEGDLEALLEGLSPKRRAAFLDRFLANLAEAERGQTALLLALGDLGRAAGAEGGSETDVVD
jgi:hypothetical protein